MEFFDTWTRRLRETREALGLALPDMAALLQTNHQDVDAWERGQLPSPTQIDQYAALLGLEVSELYLDGVGTQNLMRVLFRYARREWGEEEVPFQVGGFLPPRAALPLGQFVRSARRLDRLESCLGRAAPQAELGRITPIPLNITQRMDGPASQYAALQGGRLAQEARARWGLGDEPIPSMSRFLEEVLQIPIFCSADLPQEIEGASACVPLATILSRPAPGEPWRLRITLAHELCHLLHDRSALEAPPQGERAFFNFSPTWSAVAPGATHPSKQRKPLWSGHFRALYFLEQRARSFAASFVSPLSGVKALLQGERADTPAAAQRVADHFGVGHEVAINQICNASFAPFTREGKEARDALRRHFGLSGVAQRQQGLTTPRAEPGFQHDEPLYERATHPRLLRAILDAATQGKISLSDAWGYAARPLHEPLARPGESDDPRLLSPLRPLPLRSGP
jgi:transcriptional regulator with XRE-family HTH domain/Zn-dependent peptidase ImmA (M78 family)